MGAPKTDSSSSFTGCQSFNKDFSFLRAIHVLTILPAGESYRNTMRSMRVDV